MDYEIAHYGNPAFDVAFFTNHIVLKSAHMRQYSAAILNMLTCMTDTYFGMIDFTDARNWKPKCIPLLGILMLARIDGKSPAEYITCEKTRQLVRDMAGDLIRGKRPPRPPRCSIVWSWNLTAEQEPKMKAVYKETEGAYTACLTERPVPTLTKQDNVLIGFTPALPAAWICTSGRSKRRDCRPPIIMGHEFVGTIVKAVGRAWASPLESVSSASRTCMPAVTVRSAAWATPVLPQPPFPGYPAGWRPGGI